MSTFNITDECDELGVPAVWQNQVAMQNNVNALTNQLAQTQDEATTLQGLITDANTALDTAKAKTATVCGIAVVRAGGSLGAEVVSDVETNEDGTVTVTSA